MGTYLKYMSDLFWDFYGSVFSELNIVLRKSKAFLFSIRGSFLWQTRSLRFFVHDKLFSLSTLIVRLSALNF
jgi:hypothetical protein